MVRGIPAAQLTENRTLLPFYVGYDHELDRPRYALLPESYFAVLEGYACGECLAWFGGLYAAVCPVCGKPTGPSQAIAPWWTDYPETVR